MKTGTLCVSTLGIQICGWIQVISVFSLPSYKLVDKTSTLCVPCTIIKICKYNKYNLCPSSCHTDYWMKASTFLVSTSVILISGFKQVHFVPWLPSHTLVEKTPVQIVSRLPYIDSGWKKWCHFMWYYVTWCHVMSRLNDVMWCYEMSCYVMWYHVMTCDVKWRNVMSYLREKSLFCRTANTAKWI